MTGADFARKILTRHRLSGVSVARGTPCRYDWRERRIYLEAEIHDGRSIGALAIAAHEVAHGLQFSKMGAAWIVLISRIEPVNYLLERAAWKVARGLFAMEIAPSQLQRAGFDSASEKCLWVDARRAFFHFVGLIAILALAVLLR